MFLTLGISLFFLLFFFVMLLGNHLAQVIEKIVNREADEELLLIEEHMKSK